MMAICNTCHGFGHRQVVCCGAAACPVVNCRHEEAQCSNISSALQQDFCRTWKYFFPLCQLHSGHSELAGCWEAPLACSTAQIASSAQPLPALVTNTLSQYQLVNRPQCALLQYGMLNMWLHCESDCQLTPEGWKCSSTGTHMPPASVRHLLPAHYAVPGAAAAQK